MTPADLTEAQRELWAERAAIREFEAGLPRAGGGNGDEGGDGA